MLKKLWKQILTLSFALVSYIAGLFGDEIKAKLKTDAVDFIINYKLLYIIAVLLILLSIFFFFYDKSKNISQSVKTKKTRKQRKFIKETESKVTINGKLYKYDIDFLPGNTTPTPCNLRCYDEQTGLTENVPMNGIFYGVDSAAIFHKVKSYLNTKWDEFNKN